MARLCLDLTLAPAMQHAACVHRMQTGVDLPLRAVRVVQSLLGLTTSNSIVSSATACFREDLVMRYGVAAALVTYSCRLLQLQLQLQLLVVMVQLLLVAIAT